MLAIRRHLVIGGVALCCSWAVPAATVQKVDGGILLQGEIKHGDAQRLRAALTAYGNVALLLHSPGGQVVEALEVAHLVRSRGLRTHIPPKASCASACVLIFSGGVVRTASPAAKIGVHMGSGLLNETMMLAMQKVYREHGPAGAAYLGSMFEQAAAVSVLKQVNFYLSAGVSLRLLELSASVDHMDVRWITQREARDFNLVNAE